MYIFYIPDISCYHFHIDYNGIIIYMSLSENIKFNSFEECCLVAEEWVRKFKYKLK